MKDVLQVIKDFLSLDDYGQIDPEIVKPESDLKSLGLDSLDLVCLVNDLETKYDVSIRDYERGSISNVGDVVNFVNKVLDEQRKDV
jgi:acyl carrier protein